MVGRGLEHLRLETQRMARRIGLHEQRRHLVGPAPTSATYSAFVSRVRLPGNRPGPAPAGRSPDRNGAAILKKFIGVIGVSLGELSRGNRGLHQFLPQQLAQALFAAEQAGRGHQPHAGAVAVGDRTGRSAACANSRCDAPARTGRRLEGGGQDFGDFVVRKRLDGIVENAADAVGRLEDAVGRCQHDDFQRRSARCSAPTMLGPSVPNVGASNNSTGASKPVCAAARLRGIRQRADVRSPRLLRLAVLAALGRFRLNSSTRCGWQFFASSSSRVGLTHAIQPCAAGIGEQRRGIAGERLVDATTTPDSGAGMICGGLAGDGHGGQRQPLIDHLADPRQADRLDLRGPRPHRQRADPQAPAAAQLEPGLAIEAERRRRGARLGGRRPAVGVASWCSRRCTACVISSGVKGLVT